MVRFLKKNVEVAYAALRIVAGAMFAFHGVQLIFGVYSPLRAQFPTQLWFGGVIELVTGIAIAIGAFTSWVAFVASGTMAVAYVQFHWKLRGGTQLFPAINQGELSLLYAFLFLFVACRGGGRWSVDGARGNVVTRFTA
jgi:putative oxidoreductase